jgi:acetolactate synthase-1/2/3 large subunit
MSNDVSLITGGDSLVATLKRLQIQKIFCITGAGNLAIVDALVRDATIEVIYSHHEQAAVMEAQGYARVTGKIGVALVTTGGGTSNTLTGVLSAHLDSIPVLLISGNESSFHCENVYGLRAYGVQGFDSVLSFQNVCKSSIRVGSAEEIQVKTLEAISVSLSHRMGPVHIDIPMDLQRRLIKRSEVSLEDFVPLKSNAQILSKEKCNQLASDFQNSNSPLLYIGNGCRDKSTVALLDKIITENKIPFLLSWSAIDLFPEEHPFNVGRVGIYGDRAANILLQRADLLITIGTRLAIPQMGYSKSDFARCAKKWIFEIDSNECKKFDGLGWNVCNIDSEQAAKQIIAEFTEIQYTNPQEWFNTISKTKQAFPRLSQAKNESLSDNGFLHSADAVAVINRMRRKNSIIVTDVGAGLLSGHGILEAKEGDRIFTSQGLGEMGFGLPAAIGAFFGDKQSQLICLNTDGAIMFNLQELQVVREYQIPLKLFVFNNSGYAMIRISQDNLFEHRLSGSTSSTGISFPDFKELANLFGFRHCAVKNITELEAAFDIVNDSQTAVLIEVIMDPEQRYFPRLGTTKNQNGELVSPPLEDLDPLIAIGKLEEHLGYRAHGDSYKARNLEIPNA